MSTEKVTVTRTGDITREEIKRHDHPSEQQVGRIVIDEIPDESERIAEPKKVRTLFMNKMIRTKKIIHLSTCTTKSSIYFKSNPELAGGVLMLIEINLDEAKVSSR